MISAKQLFQALAAIVVTCQVVTAAATETSQWTLESATRRILEVSPEHRAAEAEIDVRKGELTQADAWPNPTIELRADDKLGQETGRGGSNLTQIAISQPLPFRRLERQLAVAEANFRGAQEVRRYQRLTLEREAARVFHTLQFAEARVRLARSRLELVEGYGSSGPGVKGRDPLVRYLTPLDRMRLAVMREEAGQTVLAAEQDYQKALIEFRSLLALSADAAVQAAQLELAATPPELVGLERNLETHPLLAAVGEEVAAARGGVALAESQRFDDPTFNLFYERDFINNERSDVIGFGVSFQIPLWNQNRGPVAKARAEAMRAQAQFEMRRRDTLTLLRQGYTDLARLLEQAQRTHANLLEPARQVFELTGRGFATGEANILALVDANNTYFDARSRHLELLKETQNAAAELRFAAGIPLTGSEAKP
ncbi:MAG: TolC family protein [Nitrospirota bacterium]